MRKIPKRCLPEAYRPGALITRAVFFGLSSVKGPRPVDLRPMQASQEEAPERGFGLHVFEDALCRVEAVAQLTERRSSDSHSVL